MKPIDVLRAQLLLVLEQHPGEHGYRIHKRVKERGLKGGPERTYRALRDMDEDGLVTSKRARSALGPRRRDYEVTDRGRARLAGLAAEAMQTSMMLEQLAQDAAMSEIRRQS